MTQEQIDGVSWWAIDDALKNASIGSFINYENIGRAHIQEMVDFLKNAWERNNLVLVEKSKLQPQPEPAKAP
jgi:hypothetical protein